MKPTEKDSSNELVMHPIVALALSRIRTFLRTPQAVFWTYAAPVLLLLALGFAFREAPATKLNVIVVGPQAEIYVSKLNITDELNVLRSSVDWQRQLQSGKVDAVIERAATNEPIRIWYEPSRSESQLAKAIVERELWKNQQNGNGQNWQTQTLVGVGNRYIDFLVPGMMAVNLLTGGLWGMGFVIVDMRIRGLLKRLIATPMKRKDFLLSLLLGRMLFTVCEQTAILVFSYFALGVVCRGSLLELWCIIAIGASSMIAVGMLVASRVQSSEAMGGWINLIVLPMWIVGGVFFSSDRFSPTIQSLLKLNPFVALVDSMRGIMMDGQSIFALGFPITVMAVWGVLCFGLALKFFRWR